MGKLQKPPIGTIYSNGLITWKIIGFRDDIWRAKCIWSSSSSRIGEENEWINGGQWNPNNESFSTWKITYPKSESFKNLYEKLRG